MTRCPPPRRLLPLIGVALALALPAAPPARADLHRLVLDGQIDSAGSTRKVTLRILCDPAADGGAISVELWVPEAAARKDFDYDDFEGPDAAAGDRGLSRVGVSGGTRTTEITHAAAGWYSGEGDPDTFVFGLSQRSHRPGKVATLLAGIDAKHTQLLWIQRAFDDSKRELRARFPLDATTVGRIHDTVGSCLAPLPKTKPVKK
jgi:hypothetical protein